MSDNKNILVGIVIGSDSDLETMSAAAKVLVEFGVGYEIKILSAHRTPEAACEYAKEARGRGLMAIIAAAGGAAHLPGVLAAFTSLPVIGVPMKSAALNGIDSLYSIVQMPGGIPVATVGINGAQNAGLLALRIIGVSDEKTAAKLDEYKSKLNDGVLAKNKKLEEIGYEKYLGNM